MRSRVKTGRLELPAHLGECRPGIVSERHRFAGNHAIDVEHPEPDRFHVKGTDGHAERRALVEKGLSGIGLRERLNARDEQFEAVFCSFSGFDGGHRAS